MRRGQLPPRFARMFGQFQRTGAGRGIDVIQMHDLLAHALRLDQFKCDVIILPARQAGPQRGHPHGKREPHLDARVEAFQIGFVVVQRRFHHREGKGAVGMGIEGPHDAAHVDALLFRLKADGAGDRGFQRQVAVVAGMVADRQAEIRDADMLDLGLGAHDQAGRPVLQIGQRGLVGRIRREILRVGARQRRVVAQALIRQQPRNRRVERGDFRHACACGPAAQQFQCLGRGVAVGVDRVIPWGGYSSRDSLPPMTHYVGSVALLSNTVLRSITAQAPTSDHRQGMRQVAQQVVRILDPQRQTHKAGRDAQQRLLVIRQALVRGGGGMGDDGFRIPKVVGDLDDLQRVQEREGRLLPPARSSDTTVPPDPICAIASAWWGCDASPG